MGRATAKPLLSVPSLRVVAKIAACIVARLANIRDIGCDKRLATCRARFANAVNYRGFPHMPGNDFVTYYPVPGEGLADD